MKPYAIALVLAAFSAAAIAADPLPAGHPRVGPNKQAPAAAQLTQKGKVLSVIDVPQYTYMEVMQDKKTMWIAGPTMKVKKGDMIRFENGIPMKNFHSNTLKRDFPDISFVGQVVVTKD